MILIILKEGKWLSGPHVGKTTDDTEASNKKISNSGTMQTGLTFLSLLLKYMMPGLEVLAVAKYIPMNYFWPVF